MALPAKKVPIHLQSSQKRLLIKNGTIVNWNESVDADVFIEDGIIREIGKNLMIPGGTRTINAKGNFIFPGGIDPHTHLETKLYGRQTADDFYQGTKAAIFGGTTTIIDYAVCEKGESLVQVLEERKHLASQKACCDFSFHVGIKCWSQEVRSQFEHLCTKGINSLKISMADLNAVLDDGELFDAFLACKEAGGLPVLHAENGQIISKRTEISLSEGKSPLEAYESSRDDLVELEAVNRACTIAFLAETPLFFEGMSSKLGCDTIAQHRQENDKIFASATAAGVGLDQFSSLCVTFTTPRLKSDFSYNIIKLLADGSLQAVGSDHCTFNEKGEDFETSTCGLNGIEERLSVVWERTVETGACTPNQFVAITSTNAAKLFGLFPRKGVIREGSDADLVIWNHLKSKTISASTQLHKGEKNIFEGMVVHGVAEYVIVGGRVCLEEGSLKVVEGHGKFLERPSFCPHIYGTEEVENIV